MDASAPLLITSRQVRMARAALGWSAPDLAKKAGVSRNTVLRFENTEETHLSTVTALQTALEAAGIEFVWKDGKQGVLI